MNDKKKVVILGGGVGGLAVGYYLSQTKKYEVVLLEKGSEVGGLCSSFKYNGFVLDYGAHKLYSTLPGILDEILNLFSGQLLTIPKKNKIFLRKQLVAYPLKIGNLLSVLGFLEFIKLGLGFAWQILKGLYDKHQPISYEDYMISRFGRPAYELVFQPLADKVWGYPATLHADMARVRVPASNGLGVILKLLGLKKETIETNADFFYYPRSGFAEFPRRMKDKIESMGGLVVTNAEVKGVEQAQNHISAIKTIVAGQEKSFSCDYVVSTIPIQNLVAMTLAKQAGELVFRHLILIYVFVKREMILDDQWTFFPEKDYVFSRIFEQKQMNSELGPKDQTSLCCDFTCEKESWQWQASDEELARKCIDDLVKAGIIKSEEVIGSLVKKFDNFYPRYDLNYDANLSKIIDELKQIDNLVLSGRVGMYNYNNADHLLDMGRFIEEGLSKGQAPPEILDSLLCRVKNYKIVD